MTMQAIGVNGITGRMGQLIAAAVAAHADCRLVGGSAGRSSPMLRGLPADLRGPRPGPGDNPP